LHFDFTRYKQDICLPCGSMVRGRDIGLEAVLEAWLELARSI
jgi:hypothetical protein